MVAPNESTNPDKCSEAGLERVRLRCYYPWISSIYGVHFGGRPSGGNQVGSEEVSCSTLMPNAVATLARVALRGLADFASICSRAAGDIPIREATCSLVKPRCSRQARGRLFRPLLAIAETSRGMVTSSLLMREYKMKGERMTTQPELVEFASDQGGLTNVPPARWRPAYPSLMSGAVFTGAGGYRFSTATGRSGMGERGGVVAASPVDISLVWALAGVSGRAECR